MQVTHTSSVKQRLKMDTLQLTSSPSFLRHESRPQIGRGYCGMCKHPPVYFRILKSLVICKRSASSVAPLTLMTRSEYSFIIPPDPSFESIGKESTNPSKDCVYSRASFNRFGSSMGFIVSKGHCPGAACYRAHTDLLLGVYGKSSDRI